MSYDPALTDRAARILAERGPEDRLDAAIPVHAGQTDALAMLKPHALAMMDTIAVETCPGGCRLVLRPRPANLLSHRP